MITIEDVSKWFGPAQVLRDINLRMARGEVVVICGPSGPGRSTLLRCINRLETVQNGRIVVAGEEVTAKAPAINRIRAKIGIVFQAFNLYPHMAVLRNVMLVPLLVRKLPRRQAEEIARAARQGRHCRQGSRTSLAALRRAAAARRHCTCAGDAAKVDAVRRADLCARPGDDFRGPRRDDQAHLGRNDDGGRHPLGFARKVAHRVVFMSDGAVVEEATPEEFFHRPRKPRSRAFLSKILSH